ncbi:MAG: 30S ribosomal protein S12 methylthiotransferase RimO [Prevotellaceae bacterium]|jgi:ribosomal protein S12 methylthiotransferase|nr:30S ribosomal protein S12 methylthiotransferase RimO [Prevotellaceae bacterium]
MGCSKNVVDSERLMRQLTVAGYTVVYDEARDSAAVVIINTCGFIGDAKEESINTILLFAEAKKKKQIKQLYVFGCLSQRYKEFLEKEIPEVDAYFGVTDFEAILQRLNAKLQPQLLNERQLTTPAHYAYLKISEGCNWGCAYCAIPLIRGNHISTPIEQLVNETEKLGAQGVKELLVIAQDTTSYGMDCYGRRRLADLLNALSAVKGIEWIRLHYTYPTAFPDDVIAVLRDNPKLCKYIDIPLQHIADSVLSKMRRGINDQQTRELVKRLRHEVPSIAIRTTLMVGHPGEDEEAFRELKEFVRTVRFERLGVFCYSEEEGTYAANHYKNVVPEELKQARREELMKLQESIAAEQSVAKIGTICKVIIDRIEGYYYVARTEHDSPEVDNEVLIKAEQLTIGNFYQVRITAADVYDVYAEII